MLCRTLSIACSAATASSRPVRFSGVRAPSTIIHSSPHPELDIPNKSLFDVVGEQLPQFGTRTALIDGLTHESMTYDGMYESSKRLDVALANDGAKQGDVILLHSFNCVEYPLVILALYALGAVCSPASPMFGAQELAAQARTAKAKFIITNYAFEKIAAEAAEGSGIAKANVYVMGDSSEPSKYKSINEMMNREVPPFDLEPVDPEQTAILAFSSGTTGLPKGVVLSSRNMIANTLQVSHMEKLGPHALTVLPIFHVYALMLVHVAMYQGVANVILPRFEPESFLAALSKYKIPKVHIAPPIAIFLAHHPLVDQYDLSATKYVISGGAPMGKEVVTLVAKRLGVKVKQAYGMTEASPVVNFGEDHFQKPGSVGRLPPNTELRVKCTATDKDLPHNERGELLYRGPQVMMGYDENEEATMKTLTEEGFLRTGDVGYIDHDGFVHVVDRVKELIKYKGHQVAPAELEDVLNHHPKIADACAVRGYDQHGEEIPKAYVVRKDPTLTAEEVMAFVASKVAPFKKVREVEFIDAIPKSVSGKILRRQLQDVENARIEQSAAA